MDNHSLMTSQKFPMMNLVSSLYYNVFSKFLPEGYRPYRFAGGKIYLNVRESPMMLARICRLYERHKICAVRSFLKPGMTFVDVGANKGDFSLIAAGLVGERGTVLSFEPEPNNCKWIKKSIGLNGYQNIQLFEMALGDTNQSAQLYLGEKSGWHSLLSSVHRHNIGMLSVIEKTLDSLLDDIGYSSINMIKIDVEGFELEVLKGSQRTLSNNRDIILLIDIHPYLGVDPTKVSDFLRSLDFSIHNMKKPYVPLNRSEIAEEILAIKSPRASLAPFGR